LGAGLPSPRDLWVSPEHALWIDGALVPASLLVNGETIIEAGAADDLSYLHLEFDGHAVIFAEGTPAESFVDDDSGGRFDNAARASAHRGLRMEKLSMRYASVSPERADSHAP